MKIQTLERFDLIALKHLYQSVGWQRYLVDMAQFSNMFNQSLFVLGAFVGDRLVGLVRVVGDDAHIAYIQDLLVEPSHQRQGIGRALLTQALDAVSHVRQKVLITDRDDKGAQQFYEASGFHAAIQMGIVCYVKFD